MTATVLVVEDNEPLARSVARLFEDAGAAVTITASLASALERARASPPDLAVVDVCLPGGLPSLEIVPKLREASPDAEVILVTGSATLDTAIEAVRHGVFAYVLKPFDPEDLLALGERALAQVALRKERQALERELAGSEALYRGVVEGVDQLIVGIDRAGRVGFSNRYAAEATGCAPEELEGRLFAEVVSRPEDRRVAERVVADAWRGGRVRDRELPLPRPDGAPRNIRWTLTPLRVDDEVSLVLAVGLDVTDRLELERRTAQSEALATMGALTAGLAHEIRNPLNAAKLQLEVLYRAAGRLPDARTAGSMRQRVEVVKEEIGRLSTMLDEFLQLARPRGIERLPVDVAALLDEVAHRQAPAAEEIGARIHVAREGASPVHASGDRERLAQVLVSLVTNSLEAIRSAGDGGRVVLDARGRDDGFVEVTVEDTGPGLSPEAAARLFEPFFTTKPAGTGLGLPVVKRIVEQHGGDIRIRPGEDGGTVATFTLPRDGP